MPTVYRDFQAKGGLLVSRDLEAVAGVLASQDTGVECGLLVSRDLEAVIGLFVQADTGVLGYLAPACRTSRSVCSLRAWIKALTQALSWLCTTVSKDFQARAAILDHNPVHLDSRSICALVDPSAEVLQHVVTLAKDGREIEFLSVNFGRDEDDFCMSFDLELADTTGWLACAPETEISLAVDGDEFAFLVDSRNQSRSFGQTRYNLQGRSHTSRLALPYAAQITKTWGTTTAKAVAQELCDNAGITLDWQIADWALDANALSFENAAPLDILKRLAEVQGGILQTGNNGKTLIVRHLYPVSPTLYHKETPVLTLYDFDDILVSNQNMESEPGYNAVRVMDKAFASDLDMTLEEIQDSSLPSSQRALALYTSPFTEVDLQTSGDGVEITAMGVIYEDHEETIQIVNGAGQVSRPVDEITGYAYKYADLGAVSADRNQITTASKGQSLLEIEYRAKYQKFVVTAERNEAVQFYAEAG